MLGEKLNSNLQVNNIAPNKDLNVKSELDKPKITVNETHLDPNNKTNINNPNLQTNNNITN